MVCYSSLTNSPDQNVPRRVRMLWQEGRWLQWLKYSPLISNNFYAVLQSRERGGTYLAMG